MPQRTIILPSTFRTAAMIFITVAVALFIGTLYFVWARVAIIIEPVTEAVHADILVEVIEDAPLVRTQNDNVTNGVVYVVTVEDSLTSQATGERVLPAETGGQVTVVNNYSKEQTLIATTRIALPSDPDTVIARLAATVTLQPGQEQRVPVTVEVEPVFEDQPERYIIPGLWGPLQEFIYAVPSSARTSDTSVALVTQQDLDSAEKQLKDQLYESAISQVNQGLDQSQTLWPKLITLDSSSSEQSASVGDEVANFTTSMKLTAVVVVFDESQLVSLARRTIQDSLAAERQLASLDPKNFTYELDSYDLDSQTATIKAQVSGQAVLGQEDVALDPAELVGMTAEEVEAALIDNPQINSVRVEFSPSWLRKTPRIPSKIDIKIETGE